MRALDRHRSYILRPDVSVGQARRSGGDVVICSGDDFAISSFAFSLSLSLSSLTDRRRDYSSPLKMFRRR